ncbi:hypothetical protein NJ7G_2429 [Natrinema sp. J7-2]|nr:hypothetical protein NJ7G_2429 [Natrinema sp. J7-2]
MAESLAHRPWDRKRVGPRPQRRSRAMGVTRPTRADRSARARTHCDRTDPITDTLAVA